MPGRGGSRPPDQGSRPPLPRSQTPENTVNARSVGIPLECILAFKDLNVSTEREISSRDIVYFFIFLTNVFMFISLLIILLFPLFTALHVTREILYKTSQFI